MDTSLHKQQKEPVLGQLRISVNLQGSAGNCPQPWAGMLLSCPTHQRSRGRARRPESVWVGVIRGPRRGHKDPPLPIMRGDLLHSLENFFSSLRTIPYFFVFFSFLIFYLVYFLNGGYSLQGKGLPDTGFRPGCRVLSTATSRPWKPAWRPASWLLPASVLIPLTKLGCGLTEKKDS